MAFTNEYFPYDEVITIGDENSWVKLSVTSKNQNTPYLNVQSSNSRYCIIAVPITFFAEFYDNCLVTETHYNRDLQEKLTLTRNGMEWVVKQSWEGEDAVVTTIPHKDMLKLIQYCSRKLQIRKTYSKARPLHKKVYKWLIKLYNAPRKLINW